MSPAKWSWNGSSDLERTVRPLLELMQRITGLETTFMTTIDWVAHTQTVELALNSSVTCPPAWAATSSP